MNKSKILCRKCLQPFMKGDTFFSKMKVKDVYSEEYNAGMNIEFMTEDGRSVYYHTRCLKLVQK